MHGKNNYMPRGFEIVASLIVAVVVSTRKQLRAHIYNITSNHKGNHVRRSILHALFEWPGHFYSL